jgi:hypothetical protein
MNKGDIVFCANKVVTSYEDKHWKAVILHRPDTSGMRKSLYLIPFPSPIKVILLGKSYLATGQLEAGYEYEPGYLLEDKRHVLWRVEVYDEKDNRYYEPFYAREEDLSV